MSLRFIFAGIVLGVFFIFGTAVYSIQKLIVYPAFLSIERDSTVDAIQRVGRALDRERRLLDIQCRDRASAIGFRISSRHPTAPLPEPASDAFLAENELNLQVICDAEGRILQKTFYDPTSPDAAVPAPFDTAILSAPRPLMALIAKNRGSTGVSGPLASGNRLMLIAAHPVGASDAQSPAEGILILGRFVAERLSSSPASPLAVSEENPITAPFAETLEIPGADDARMVVNSNGDIRVAFSLATAFGDEPIWLDGTMPRRIAAKGVATINRTLYSLLLVGLLIFTIMLVLMKKAFLTPITELTDHIRESGETGTMTLPPSVRRNDEIGFLASEFKQLYRQLKKKTDSLQETNHRLAADIASRKAAEKALHLSEYRHRLLIENLPQKIIFKDRDSVYITCNERFAKGLGFRREDIEGKTDHDLIPKPMAEKFENVDQRIMASGRAEEVEEISIKNDRRRVIQTLKVPVRDEQGDIVGVLGILSDITERRNTEEALRHQTAYMTALHETAVGMLNRLDIDELLNIIMVRASEFIRIPNGALYLYVPEDDVLEIRAACGAFSHRVGIRMGAGEGFCGHVMQRREAMIIENYRAWHHRLGETALNAVGAIIGVPLISGERTIGVISLAYVDSDEQIEPEIIPYLEQFGRLASIALDNARLHERVKSELKQREQLEAERTRIEARLRQAQKMESVGTLAGGIAHDFNNLLMGIQGRVSLMMLDAPEGGEFAEHLAGIEALVASASDLTRQLLGFAKGGKYEVKPVDINDLIQDVTRMFARTAKEVDVRTRFAPEAPIVSADPGQIKQVLLNLLVNARQAMPGGGLLRVSTECIVLTEDDAFPHQVAAGEFVKISIMDTGTGMAPHVKERIFDPFFTTKEMGRGTGLGLASAWGIVENHDGYIQVFSRPGEGTTFDVVLPRTKAAALRDDPAPPEPLQGSETILLVDDEPLVLDVGAQMLEKMGHAVITAKSGPEAIAVFREKMEDIDLVILDMIMPDMNGAETFEALRSVNPAIKILLSSGYSLDGQASDIMARGCNGFIQKPFNMAKLSGKIREVLAASPADQAEPDN